MVSGLNGNDAGSDEGSVLLDEASGTINITNATVSGGFEDNLRVLYDDTAARTATFNVTGSTFRDLQAAGQNSQVNLRTATTASSASNVTFNFTGANVFENDANTLPPGGTENWSDGILVTFGGPFQHTFNVQNATFHHCSKGWTSRASSARTSTTRSSTTRSPSPRVSRDRLGNGSTSTNQSLVTGLIQGNTIGSSGVAQSGSRLGQGIVLDFRGEETAQMTLHANTIRRVEVGGTTSLRTPVTAISTFS